MASAMDVQNPTNGVRRVVDDVQVEGGRLVRREDWSLQVITETHGR